MTEKAMKGSRNATLVLRGDFRAQVMSLLGVDLIGETEKEPPRMLPGPIRSLFLKVSV